MEKYIIVIIIFLTSMFAYSSNNNIVIVKAKSTDCKDTFDIFLIESCNNCEFPNIIYMISCKEELSDFTYKYLLKKEENILLIFEEYNSPAGLTKIHFLDIKKGILYSSDFLKEEKVPLHTTVNIRNAYFKILDIDTGDYVQVPLIITWKKEESKQLKNKEIETLQTIDYQY